MVADETHRNPVVVLLGLIIVLISTDTCSRILCEGSHKGENDRRRDTNRISP